MIIDPAGHYKRHTDENRYRMERKIRLLAWTGFRVKLEVMKYIYMIFLTEHITSGNGERLRERHAVLVYQKKARP
jgi:hypothetical protein